MKKNIAVFMLLIMVVFLSSCKESEQSEQETQTTSVSETTLVTTAANQQTESAFYSAEVAQRMGNNNAGNYFRVTSEGLYYMQPDDNEDYLALTDINYSDTSFITKVEGLSDIWATEDNLYFLLTEGDYSYLYQSDFYGERIKRLVNDPIAYLFIYENNLYYTPVNTSKTTIDGGETTINLMKCALDGSNQEVVLSKEVYYPYIINNKLFYQDDNDQETEHVYDLTTKEDVRVTNEKTYCFLAYGHYGYYIHADIYSEQYSGSLRRVDLNTGETITLQDRVYSEMLLISNDRLYFDSEEDNANIYSVNLDGQDVRKVSTEGYCSHGAIWNGRLYYDSLDDEGYIDKIVVCNLDGSNKHVFFDAYN